MPFDSVAFHNVGELRETAAGHRLQRVPDAVRRELNEGSRERMLIPSSSELRFVAEGDRIAVTLSCPAGQAEVVPFWGPFQGSEPVSFGPGPEAIELTYPDALAGVDPDRLADQPFSHRVWRLRFQYDSPGSVYVHGVDGDGVRPPRTDELPSTRLLAYGTSITEGVTATRDHLTYPWVAARRLGFDCLNFGSAGSAYCEPALADYFASRADWDLATVALSSNMMNAGFSLDEFRDRASYMLRTLADARPDAPVVAITIYRRHWDVDPSAARDEWAGTPDEFRAAYRDAVDELDRDNISLLEGPNLLTDVGGASADLVHPGDYGMAEIGERLARRLRTVPDGDAETDECSPAEN